MSQSALLLVLNKMESGRADRPELTWEVSAVSARNAANDDDMATTAKRDDQEATNRSHHIIGTGPCLNHRNKMKPKITLSGHISAQKS